MAADSPQSYELILYIRFYCELDYDHAVFGYQKYFIIEWLKEQYSHHIQSSSAASHQIRVHKPIIATTSVFAIGGTALVGRTTGDIFFYSRLFKILHTILLLFLSQKKW